MHPPIRHQSAGVIPKPTKFEMETIRVKWSFLCRPEPTVVMNTCGYGSIRLNRNTVHPPLICPCFHQSYFTQFTRMHKIDSIFKMLLAPLPLAHLHNAIVLQCCSNHRSEERRVGKE